MGLEILTAILRRAEIRYKAKARLEFDKNESWTLMVESEDQTANSEGYSLVAWGDNFNALPGCLSELKNLQESHPKQP